MSLDLSNNKITTLPGWGYWPEHFWDMWYHFSAFYEFGESFTCPWLYMSSDDAILASTVPTWPVLTKVVMDGNDFGSGAWASDVAHPSMRRFLSFFAQAPELSSLSCNDCRLSGNLDDPHHLSILHYFEPTEEDHDGVTKTVCINQAAFKNLQSISFGNSPNITFMNVSCQIMDAETLLAENFCYRCAEGSLVPTGVTPLLTEQAECTCAPTLITGYAYGGPYCGCASGSYYDSVSTSCKECPDAYDCDWNDNIVMSRTLPKLRPGYWAECISDRKHFDPAATHECLSTDICIGGSVQRKEACSESSLCDESRSGYGCARCLEGQTGLPGEPCGPCFSSPGQVRLMLLLASLVVIPCFIPLIWAIIDNGTKDSSRQGWVQIKRLKSALRGLLRHLQLIGVFHTINIEWPNLVVEAMKMCQVWSARFDGLVQLGCLTGQQTGTWSLVIAWLTPLYVGVLVMLSVLTYCVGNFLLKKFCGCGSSKRLSYDSGFIFIHFLWVVYFASLTSSVLFVFTCKEQSNGKMTVEQFPDITCGELEYWPVAAGGFAAFLFYVVAFFVVSYFAMKRVQLSLVETAFEDKGPFEFAVDGLRVPCLSFNLLAAMKDVVLNMIIVIFVNEAVGQLLLSALVLIMWSIVISRVNPYDTWTANWLDISASGGLGALLLTTAGFGFAVPGSSDMTTLEEMQGNGEIWLSILLFITLGVPNLLVLLEIGKLFPQFERRLPKSLQSPSHEMIMDEIKSFQDVIPSEVLYDTMTVFDFQEWNEFRHVFGTSNPTTKRISTVAKNPSSAEKKSSYTSKGNNKPTSGSSMMGSNSSWAASTKSCGSPLQRKCSLDLVNKAKLAAAAGGGGGSSSAAIDNHSPPQKAGSGLSQGLGNKEKVESVTLTIQESAEEEKDVEQEKTGNPKAEAAVVDTTPPRSVEDGGGSFPNDSESSQVLDSDSISL